MPWWAQPRRTALDTALTSRKDPSGTAPQAAAEAVRAHLVTLRGGAPFLSPRDGELLVQWLDAGVSVAAICCALERAAEARRKRPSRIPLSLAHARRHLGKAGRPTPVPPASGHPLAPVAAAARAEGEPGLEALAEDLLALDPGAADLVDRALDRIRRYHDEAWRTLPPEARSALVAEAEAALDRILGEVDDGRRALLVEAYARDRLRTRTPYLSAATVCDLVGAR